jgi:hypothetical protein
MDDEAIRRLLSEAEQLSMVVSPPGMVSISRDRFALQHGRDAAQGTDAFVERVGGAIRQLPPLRPSRRQRIGQQAPRARGPRRTVWDVPRDALRRPSE